MNLASLIRLFLLAAIWGASFLFMRIGVPVFGPAALIALRVGIAALFLGLVAVWLRRGLALRRHARHFMIVGLLNTALPFLLFAYAAQTLSASLLSILNTMAPLFGAAIAARWLHTPLGTPAAAGLLCGLAGVAVLVGSDNAPALGDNWPAIAAALLAPLCYGIASAYAKARKDGPLPISAFDNAHGSMWAATLLVAPLAFLAPLRETPGAGDFAAVTALGIVCTGAAYLLYFRLIEDAGPTRALSVTFLIPVFGVLWGALFLNEPVGWSTLAGGALVLAGIALTNDLFGGLRRCSAALPGERS